LKHIHLYLRLIVLATLFSIIASCDTKPTVEEDIAAIYNVLKVRQQAIEKKDLSLYRSLFLPEYADAGVSVEDIAADMERMFSRYEHITFSYKKTRPSIKMNSSRIVHWVELQTKNKSKKIQEVLLLRKVEKRWLISGGVKIGIL